MIQIRLMTIDDLQLGLTLNRQAGWNQTESDWLRFMALEPTGCFVAELDGYAVGTTATCISGQVAWIAMVLVDVNARGKGVGTELLKHSLKFLQQRKVRTVRLDATPVGRRIYEKLGFVPEYELARFESHGQTVNHFTVAPFHRRTVSPSHRFTSAVTKATPEMFTSIIEFDSRMTGTNRARILKRLFEEFPQDIHVLRCGDKIEGFVTKRPGANAVQIGPCVATTDAGPTLLVDALNRCEGKPVFVDMPLDNTDAVKIAESSGLRIQRCFMRMYRGEKVKDNVKALWASSGPEKG